MFEDASDHNKRKIWSETYVSQEFDMALRLMVCFLSECSPRF